MTKEVVLQAIHSVSLVHLAAHGDDGDDEREKILLSPNHLTPSIPREGVYLLTMAEISQIQL